MQPDALRVFYSYSHRDEKYRKKLEAHLSLLQHQGVIRGWHDRKISAGEEWKGRIDEQLEEADIVLLLISADFLASRYCYDVEMARALEKHTAGSARVIPVIVRPTDWQEAPFAHLQALPTDAKPVTGRGWHTQDEAWADVARGIRAEAQGLLTRRPSIETEGAAMARPSNSDAVTAYTESLDLWRQLNDRQGQAHALLNLGLAYDSKGDWDASVAAYRECRALLHELRDAEAEAQVLAFMGLVYDRKGDYDAAIAAFEKSLPLFDATGDRWRKAQTLETIGLVYDRKACRDALHSDRDAAVAAYEQSNDLWHELGDRDAQDRVFGNLNLARSRPVR